MQSSSPFPSSFRLTTPSAKPPTSSVSDSLKQLLDQSRQLHAGIISSSSSSSLSLSNQLSSDQLLSSSAATTTAHQNPTSNHHHHHFQGSLPTVQLGLDQIESQSRRLISKIRKNDNNPSELHSYNPQQQQQQPFGLLSSSKNRIIARDKNGHLIDGQGTASSRAHFLLASAGVNAEELAKTIDAVDLRRTFEPLQPLQDTDVEGYLKHEHEQSIIASIEEGRRKTIQDFYRALDRSLSQNWQEHKELMFEELTRHQPQSSPDALFSISFTHSHLNTLSSDLDHITPHGSPEQLTTRRSTSRAPFSDITGFNNSQLAIARNNPGPNHVDIHGKMMKYDQAVTKLNERRRQNVHFPIVEAFKQASISVTEDGTAKLSQQSPLTDTWNLLSQIVQERNIGVDDRGKELIGGIRLTTISDERKYAKHYLGNPNSLEAKNLRKQITDAARSHLEKQFLTHINMQIEANPVEANLGGDPSTANKVRAYTELRFSKNGSWIDKRLEIINNTPVWARIFYLLRIGQVSEAIQFTQTQEQHIRKSEPNFLSYFSSWANSLDKKLSKNLRDRFLAEYNQRIREVSGMESSSGSTFGVNPNHATTANVDPFKHAVYKIIGRVEIQRKNVPVAITSMEDWIWLQLVLVKEPERAVDHHQQHSTNTSSPSHHTSSSSLQDRYGLEEFGHVISKYGENHFDPNGNRPLMYFRVLLMSGQFEKAILFLQQKPHYQLDAVHLAIALAYYGLLRISDNSASSEGHSSSYTSSSLNRSQTASLPTVNFTRLIYRYTRLFAKNSPEVAVQYLYLICLNADVQPPELGKNQVKMCHCYIGELAVETASHEELLGDVRNDGTRVPGIIERDLSLIKLSSSEDYLETIVKQAAERAFRERRLRDAIRLFNIAEEYDRVIGVLNIELGNSLSQPGGWNSVGMMTRNLGDEEMNEPDEEEMNNNTGRYVNKAATISLTASEDIVTVARNIIEHYDRTSSISNRITRKNRETCGLLLRLKNVLDLHEQGKNEQALVMLDSVELLPTGNDLIQIIRKTEEVKELDDGILKNLDVIVLNGMKILYSVYCEIKNSPYGDLSRQTKMAEIKTKARAITTFAGMLRYRLSAETYSQLSRLQAYLH